MGQQREDAGAPSVEQGGFDPAIEDLRGIVRASTPTGQTEEPPGKMVVLQLTPQIGKHRLGKYII